MCPWSGVLAGVAVACAPTAERASDCLAVCAKGGGWRVSRRRSLPCAWDVDRVLPGWIIVCVETHAVGCLVHLGER